jgi:hypothetical protein
MLEHARSMYAEEAQPMVLSSQWPPKPVSTQADTSTAADAKP